MNNPTFFDFKNSFKLFGLEDEFKLLNMLYSSKRLPKVLMLSGNKGSGKATLLNHFLYSIFDKKNYNLQKFVFSDKSTFHNQNKNNVFLNIIYLNGSNFNLIKVDDIRNLKNKISQSTISNKERFIILDDIELFNKNSLNALLKIIEEPTKNNYFVLINNKSKPLLETIKSRSLEIKVILKEKKRLEIIKNLITTYQLEEILNPSKFFITPGNFIKFNYICKEYEILPNNDFIKNISILLNLYKKNKDILFINIAFFISDYYFKSLKDKNVYDINKIYDDKNFIFDNLNNYLLYNINQNALLNAMINKLKYE